MGRRRRRRQGCRQHRGRRRDSAASVRGPAVQQPDLLLQPQPLLQRRPDGRTIQYKHCINSGPGGEILFLIICNRIFTSRAPRRIAAFSRSPLRRGRLRRRRPSTYLRATIWIRLTVRSSRFSFTSLHKISNVVEMLPDEVAES